MKRLYEAISGTWLTIFAIIFTALLTHFSSTALAQCPLQPDFSFTQFSCDSIQFKNTTTLSGPGLITAIEWDFNDGNTSTLEPVNHFFNHGATYNVQLTVTDSSGCQRSVSYPISLVDLPQPDFTWTRENCIDIVFENTTSYTGSTPDYLWDLDGTTYTEENPTHTFAMNSSFPVSLTVTDELGCTVSKNDLLTLPAAPTANFTFSPDNMCSSTPVTFDASGSTNAYAYNWDFTDGSGTVSVLNPIIDHTFNAFNDPSCTPTNQDFLVSLTVSDIGGCQSSLSKMATAIRRPQPRLEDITPLSINPFSNCENTPTISDPDYYIEVQNITPADGCIATYSLDWGDGSPIYTSNDPAFSTDHLYTSLGTFNLKFTATNNNGCIGDTTYVIANQSNPAGGILSLGSSAGCAPVDIPFGIGFYEGNSPGTIYRIDFNDGQVVNYTHDEIVAQTGHITHTYTQSSCDLHGLDSYVVTCQIINQCDTTTSTVNNVKISSPPDIEIQFAVNDTVCYNDSVCINNLTTPGYGTNCDTTTTFFWDFGDGNTSDRYSPCNLYDLPGEYTITMDAINPECGSTDTTFNVLVVGVHPDFTYVKGCSESPVQFTDLSYCYSDATFAPDPNFPITNWLWNFGDGNTSNEQNPLHTYVNPGTYNVSLIAGNDYVCDSIFSMMVVSDSLPVASFTFADNCLGHPTQFTDISRPHAASTINWNWDFGDGNTSTDQNPTHIYASAGIYPVTLQIENSNNCVDDTTVMVEIHELPVALFTHEQACLGEATIFTDHSTATVNITNWNWDFSDGETSTEQNPTHIFPDPISYNVSLVIEDEHACVSDPYIQMVIIDSLPTANFEADTACFNSPTSFTNLSVAHGSANDQWAWNFGDPTTGINNTSPLQNPSHIYSAPGTYTVELITFNQNGCSDTITKDILVYPLPVADFSATEVCIGNTTLFTDLSIHNASSLVSWSWNFDDGFTSDQQNPSHTYTLAATYNVTLTVINDNGCVKDTTIAVVVNPLPTPAFTSSATCLGSTTQFTDVSGDGGAAITSWNWNFGDGQTSSLQHPTHDYANANTYNVSLFIENANGCSALASQEIVVDSLPVAAFSADKVCAKTPTTFTDLSESHGTPNSTWDWSFGDGNSSNLQNPQHIYMTPGIFDARLIVGNTTGCTDTILHQVFVDSIPLVDFTYSGVCLGDPTLFSDNTVGVGLSGPLTDWAWNFGDGNTSTDENPTHTYAAPGLYDVQLVVTNIGGCSDTATKALEITAYPTAQFSPDFACLDKPTQFTDLSNDNGFAIVSWLWDFGGGHQSTQQNPQYTFTTAGTQSVSLTVTNYNGCSNMFTQVVTISESVPYPAFHSVGDCDGEEIHFVNTSTHVGSGFDTYAWNFGDPASGASNTSTANEPTHTFSGPGTYTVTLVATSNSGCIDSVAHDIDIQISASPFFTYSDVCFGQAVNLTDATNDHGIALTSWNWNLGDGNTATGANVAHTYAMPGTYSVTLSVENANGCINDTTLLVNVFALPTADFSATKVCNQQATDFTDLSTPGDGTINNWNWQFDDGNTSTDQNPNHTYTTAGIYTAQLTVTDNNGCSDTYSQNVTVDTLPTAAFTWTDVSLGDPMTFTNGSVAHGSLLVSHDWDFGDGNTSSNLNPTHTYLAPGIYDVTLSVTDANGCIDAVTHQVTVFGLPGTSFTATTECLGHATQFIDTSVPNGAPIIGWAWDFDDGNSSTEQNPLHTYAAAGTYNVSFTTTDGNGSTSTVSMPVTVHPLPIAAFDVTRVCNGFATDFTDLSNGSGSPITTWDWDMDDGNNLSDQNPVHTYANAGIYNVSLTVTNANGCQATTSQAVTVDTLPTAAYTYTEVPVGTATTFTDGSSAHGAMLVTREWDFDDGNNSTDIHPTHTFAAAGTYHVRLIVTDSHLCKDTIYHDVNVWPLPGPDFTATTGCFGVATQFTDISSSPVATIVGWNWIFDDPTSGIDNTSTLQNPEHLFTAAGNYNVQLTITDNFGGTDQVTKTVTVYELPLAQFSNTTVCLHQGTEFTDLSSGIDANLSDWSWDFGDGSTATDQNPVYTYANAGLYNVSLTVTDLNGCSQNIVQNVTIDSLPVANFSASRECLNQNTVFTNLSTAHGSANTSYHWSFGDGTTSTDEHPVHRYLTDGTFDVQLVVSNQNACTDTLIQAVIVDPLPEAEFSFTAVSLGEATDFTDLSTANAATITDWYWDFGDPASGVNNTSNLQHPAHTFTSDINYNVMLVVTNSNGCIDTVFHTVGIYALPVSDFESDTVCFGYATTFTDLSSSLDGAIVSWNWDFDDPASGVDNTSTLQHPQHLFTSAGIFSVKLTVTNINGASATLAKGVVVHALPVPAFTATTACFNTPTLFTDLSSGSGSPITSWEWNFGDPASGANNTSILASPEHLYSAAGDYTVQLIVINQHGCTDTISQTVSVNPLPNAEFSNDVACFGNPTQLTDLSTDSGSALTTWYWDFGDGTVSNNQNPVHIYGNYGINNTTLTVTDGNGCSNSIMHPVLVDSLPIPNFSVNNPCNSNLVYFTDLSDPNGSVITSYFWDFGDGNFSNLQNPIHHFPLNNATYDVKLVVGNGIGCSDSIVIPVFINPAVAIDFTADTACFGSPTTFNDTVLSPGVTITAIEWDFGDGTTSNQHDPVHSFASAGIFNVYLTMTDDAGCAVSTNKSVLVYPAPLVAFKDSTSCTNDTTYFTDLSTSPSTSLTNWHWDFGDGNSSNLQNPIYHYAAAGVYPVTLTVTNSNGCAQSHTQDVYVYPRPTAAFNTDIACVGNPTHFTDLSTSAVGILNSWEWNFGDGTTSTLQDPTHTFASDGIYPVQLVVGNDLGCSDTIVQNVIVNALPMAAFTADTVCLGQLTSFSDLSSSAFGTITGWVWDFGDGTGSNDQNPQHQFTTSGTHNITLVVTDNAGCSSMTSASIWVDLLPLVNFDWSTTVCASQEVAFTDLTAANSTSIASWHWFFGDGQDSLLTGTPSGDITHIYPGTGTYDVSLQVTNSNGCVSTLTRTIGVSEPPAAGFTFAGACWGNTTQFTDASVAALGSVVAWNWNFGEPVSGPANTSNLQNPTHTYSNAGIYDVELVVRSNNGCTDTIHQLVEIHPKPTADFTFTTECLNDSTHFTDSSTAALAPITSWSWDFGDGSIATDQNPVHLYTHSGQYHVNLTVTDANGCDHTTTKMLQVNPLPTAMFTVQSACMNNAAYFTDFSNGAGSAIVAWHWNFGDPLSGVNNNSTLQNPTHNYAAAGIYVVSLSITNANGCTSTYSQNVNVAEGPVAAFTVDTTCLGNPVYFNNTSYAMGTTINSWIWDFGDGSFSNLQFPQHTYSIAGTYQVKLIVETENGCVNTVTHPVEIHALPVVNFTTDGPVCFGETVHFTDLSHAAAGSNNVNSWFWEFGDGNTSTEQHPSHVYTAPGTYNVTLTAGDANSCQQSLIQQVEVSNPPISTFTYSIHDCDSVQFIDNSVAVNGMILSWKWDFDDPASGINNHSTAQNPHHLFYNPGTYQVSLIITNTAGCVDTSYQEVIISRPIADFNASIACLGNPTDFTDLSTSVGDVIVNWLWDFGDGNTSTNQNPSHIYATEGTFFVHLTVTNSSGCQANIAKPVEVNSAPTANFEFAATCFGDATQFTDLSTPNGANPITSWSWDFGDGNTSTEQHPEHTYISPNSYVVTLTVAEANGCTNNISKVIDVYPGPTAGFDFNTACLGELTSFTDTSIPSFGNLTDWHWDFGDGQQASDTQNPNHVYATAGTYTVQLVVRDESICPDTLTQTVVVNDLPAVAFNWSLTCMGEATQFSVDPLVTPIADITAWSWTFGDPASGAQNSSSLQDPQHTYILPGIYYVELTVTDINGCSNTQLQEVEILPAPLANFTYVSDCADQDIAFTDLSVPNAGHIDQWVWNYGDGSDNDTIHFPSSGNVNHRFPNGGSYLVQLSITTSKGCISSYTHAVEVMPIPEALFTYAANCEGNATQFTDLSLPNGEIASWSWDFGDPASGIANLSAAQNPTHFFSGAGDFNVSLTVTNNQGCQTTIQQVVHITAGPTLDFTAGPACLGTPTQFLIDSVTTNAAAVATWHWDFGDGLYSNLANPDHVYANNGIYPVTLTITDTLGCYNSITHEVTVRPLPIAFFDYTEPTCLNDAVMFTDLSSTETGYITTWIWSWGDGSENDTIHFPNEPHKAHLFATEGTYPVSLTVINSHGCSHSITQEVSVIPNPIANFYYSLPCEGETVQFTDASFQNGTGNILSWNWNFDDPTSGINNSSVEQNPEHQFTGLGSYDVQLIIVNFNNCSDTIVKTITVNPAPAVDFSWIAACENEWSQFMIDPLVVDTNLIAEYHWEFGDGQVSNLRNPIHQFVAAGTYNVSLTVTDTIGCSNTAMHEVSISALPLAHFDYTLPDCPDMPVSFNDLSSEPVGHITSWNWDFGDGTSSTILFPDNPNVEHTYLTEGVYDVVLTVTNNLGCSDTETKQLTIIGGPIANFDFSGNCENEAVQFNDLSQSNGGVDIMEWSWNFGDPLSGINNSSTEQNPLHTFSAAGTYQVTLTITNLNGCTAHLTQSVIVHPLPPVDFASEAACVDEASTFSVDETITHPGAIAEWYWNFGDGAVSVEMNPQHIYTLPGTYTVTLTVTDTSACSNSVSHEITISPLPVAHFDISPAACSNSPVYFTDLSNAETGYLTEWHWNFGDGNDTTIYFPDAPHVNHTYATTGTYDVTLTVTTDAGCSHSEIQTVNIQPDPVANFDFTNNCEGQEVSFTDLSQANGGGDVNHWEWDFNDPLSGVNNTSLLQNPQHLFSGPGVYQVQLTITNTNGCSSTLSRAVTINNAPTAEFSWTAGCIDNGTTFQVDETITNAGAIANWDWAFGDGFTSVEMNPVHVYTASGNYIVNLTVTDTLGCSATISHEVEITPLPVPFFDYSAPTCEGAVTNFTDLSSTVAGYITEWHWNYGDGHDTTITFPGNPNVNHTYEMAGIYNVILTVTNSNGCENDFSQEVEVLSGPMANFEYSASCLNQPVSFTDLSQTNGSGDIIEWSWDFGDPVTGINNYSNLQNPVHLFSGEGTYTVSLSLVTASGCTGTISQQLTVSPLPAVDFSFSTPTCEGDTTYFTIDATVTNLGALATIDWYFGDGTANSDLENPAHLFDLAGTYDVLLTITDTAGCSNQIIHPVVVNPLPEANFSYETTCIDNETLFSDESFTHNGEDIVAWLWNFNDPNATAGSNTSTDQNPTHIYTVADEYLVTLTVTSESGCQDSITIPVNIYDLPTSYFKFINDPCSNGLVAFQDSSYSANTSIVSWYWEFLPGYTSTVQNPEFTFIPDSCYNVSLTVTDGRGCSNTAIQEVCVAAGLEIELSHSPTCLGEETQFFSELLSPENDTIATYSWDFGDPASGNANTSTEKEPFHLYAHAGSYTVTLMATDVHDCISTAYHQLIVHTLPEPDFSYESAVCDSMVYFTDLTQDQGDISRWIWQYGDGSQADTIYPPATPNVAHKYLFPGTYSVSLTAENDRGCTQSITRDIERKPCVVALFNATASLLCTDQTVSFKDSSYFEDKIENWFWEFGDGESMTYSIKRDSINHTYAAAGDYLVQLVVSTTLENGTAFYDTISHSISVFTAPTAEFIADAVCFGESTEFINTTLNHGTTIDSCLWDFGNNHLNTTEINDTSSLLNPVYHYLEPGNFPVQLIVYNHLGCTDTARLDAVVHRLPKAGFEYETSCDSIPTMFFDNSDSADIHIENWNWNFGDTLSLNDTAHIANPEYMYITTGNKAVQLIVEDAFGCTDTISRTITTHPKPISAFSLEENVEELQGQIQLENETTGGVEYEWDFGNGYTSEEVSPLVLFDEDGNYEITLISYNEFGCPDTAKYNYELLYKGLYVPNAFAPGNPHEGVNIFQPKGVNLKLYHMQVFNSWGTLLWESTKLDEDGSPVESWDGTYNGTLLPQDTYIWKAIAVFRDGTPWEGKDVGNNEGGTNTTHGTVTLIR